MRLSTTTKNKMKSINPSSKSSEIKKLSSDNICSLEQGIVKTLLKKYKPRDSCDVQNSSKNESQRRAA